MTTLAFFLEEPSAKEMLQGILPRLIPPEINPRFVVFNGKQDLEKNLVKRLKGWNTPDTIFIVIRDQDSGDCKDVKTTLQKLCILGGNNQALVRVACRELESFYLGDLAAVEQGLGLKNLRQLQGKRKYRSPDQLGSPSNELARLTGGRYQKISGSRVISRFLNLERNRSDSFNALILGITNRISISDSTI